MNLPKQLPWIQASNQWPAILNPVIANPLINGQQVDQVVLKSGVQNTIYHSLDQLPQGWFVVDANASANVFRTKPFNNKTLTLEANADVIVSVWIY